MFKRYLTGAALAVGVAAASIPAITTTSNAAAFTMPTQLEKTTAVKPVHWRRYRHGSLRRRWIRHCHPRWRHNFRRPFCHSHRYWW